MRAFKPVLFGIFFAGSLFGAWWIPLASGVVLLMFAPSYIILIAGVYMDLLYAPAVGTSPFFGFYSAIFFVVAILAELVRRRLLWGTL